MLTAPASTLFDSNFTGKCLAAGHMLVPSVELAKTELFEFLGGPKINEPDRPSRQPGYPLMRTHGFPSPSCDGFGFFLKLMHNIS
jgi:hypothetical protein